MDTVDEERMWIDVGLQRHKTIKEQLDEKKIIVESQKKVKVEKLDLKKKYDRVV